METENNKSSTFVSGSIEDLNSCNKIILYRSDSFSRINITNMNSIIELLVNTGNYLILNREDEDFIYNKIDTNNNIRYSGFNIIIYLNHLDIPIGYTEFNTVQGLIPTTVIIKTAFSTSEIENEEEDTIVLNSLSDTIKEYVSLTDKLISNQSFVTKKEILGKEKRTNIRYTNSISDIVRDPQKVIYTPRGILTSNGFKKLNLITEMDLTGDEKYFQLGYYNGEIVIYLWNDTDITIKSLSRKDLFGNNIIYLHKHNLGGYIPIYFSGRYMSATTSEGARVVVDIINNEKITLEENSNHIIDLWGTRSQIIELPKPLNRRNLIECLPDVLNLKIDIKNYKQTINLEKKIGEWYVFKEKRSNLSNIGNSTTLNFKIYTNLVKTVTICEEYDKKEPIIINNNTLALETEESGENYYTYFLGEKDYYSENALMALDLVMGKLNVSNNKFLNQNQNCIQYGDTNSEYYENGELVIDHIGNDIVDSYCFNLRKNKCPDDFKVPQFIGAINGLIYYKTGNKIKLL